MSSPSRARRRRLLRELTACPDCTSDAQVISDNLQAPRVRIAHDSTCPWYVQRNDGAAFTQLRVVRRSL